LKIGLTGDWLREITLRSATQTTWPVPFPWVAQERISADFPRAEVSIYSSTSLSASTSLLFSVKAFKIESCPYYLKKH